MNYDKILKGVFLSRPNRFIAYVDLDGKTVTCHVKNTGRCRELLIPGVTVILEYFPKAGETGRKTSYDLIAVYKDSLLINMDSQAPNKAALEWLQALSHQASASTLPLSGSSSPFGSLIPADIRREVTYKDSRFDLAFTLTDPQNGESHPAFMEVKGVTLEENGQVRFPDAPTERGVKHLCGLMDARSHGFLSYVLFVIQMKGVHSFSPNDITHPAFGQTLRQAQSQGVQLLAYDCLVTPDTMVIDAPVKIVL